jgi:hypothetical protein
MRENNTLTNHVDNIVTFVFFFFFFVLLYYPKERIQLLIRRAAIHQPGGHVHSKVDGAGFGCV